MFIPAARACGGPATPAKPCGAVGLLAVAAAALTLLAAAGTGVAAAEPDSQRIDRIKAAFVLNIARFVSWPAEEFEQHPEQLLLCLYRHSPFGQAIETIHGKKVAGRRLRINRIQSLSESRQCNILLIPGFELEAFMRKARPRLDRPLLTIADLTTDLAADGGPRSTHDGVLVTLVRAGTRIGFEINLRRARRVGLKMSSKLLKLATIVGD